MGNRHAASSCWCGTARRPEPHVLSDRRPELTAARRCSTSTSPTRTKSRRWWPSLVRAGSDRLRTGGADDVRCSQRSARSVSPPRPVVRLVRGLGDARGEPARCILILRDQMEARQWWRDEPAPTFVRCPPTPTKMAAGVANLGVATQFPRQELECLEESGDALVARGLRGGSGLCERAAHSFRPLVKLGDISTILAFFALSWRLLSLVRRARMPQYPAAVPTDAHSHADLPAFSNSHLPPRRSCRGHLWTSDDALRGRVHFHHRRHLPDVLGRVQDDGLWTHHLGLWSRVPLVRALRLTRVMLVLTCASIKG